MKTFLLLFLLGALTVSASAGTVTGTIQKANGQPIKAGVISFALSQAGTSGSTTITTDPVYCGTSVTGTVVGLADPGVAPILSVNTQSGSLPAGNYYVTLTYTAASGESVSSPEAVLNLSGSGTLTITAPTLQPGNATGYKVYIGTTSGSETLQGTVVGWTNYSQTAALAAGASAPASNTTTCTGIFFNDAIVPSYTTYKVNITDSQAKQVSGYPQSFYLQGTTVDLSTLTPAQNVYAKFPNAIVAQPAGGATQSIAGNLNVNGSLTATSIAAGTGGMALSGVGSLDAIAYIDGKQNVSLDAYLVAPTGNRTVIIPSNQTLTTRPTISVSGLKLKCENKAVITVQSAAGFNFTGANDGIEDCTFVGPGAGTTGNAQLVTSTGNGFYFRRNNVSAFGAAGGNGQVEIIGGSQGEVSDNTFTGNGEWNIFVNAVTAASTMNDFRVERNQAQNIIVHTTGAGSSINHVVIVGNDLYAGSNSNVEFCVEVGAFGGNYVTDVSVSGNHCYLQANGSNGGYSMSGVGNYSVTGNTFDNNGFTFTVAAFENANSIAGAVVGNQAIAGTGGAGFTCIAGYVGVTGTSQCSRMTFSGNVLVGWLTASSQSGYYFGTSTTNGQVLDNLVVGNTAIFPTAGAGKAFWLQCNAVGSTCNGNTFSSNHVLSDGTALSAGISLELDTGTVINNFLSSNSIQGPSVAFNASASVGAKYDDRSGVTVAQLPTVATANAGSWVYVTDSTTVTAEGQTCAGGGTTKALAFSNGAAWKCF